MWPVPLTSLTWTTSLTLMTSAAAANGGKVRSEWVFDSGRFCKAAHLRIANPILFKIASRHLSSGSVATYPCKRCKTSPSSISCRPSSVQTKQNHYIDQLTVHYNRAVLKSRALPQLSCSHSFSNCLLVSVAPNTEDHDRKYSKSLV